MPLIHLFDRLWTPTLIYAALATTAYFYRGHGHLPALTLLLATFWYIRLALHTVNVERRISSLGLRAPSKRTPTPWNIGVLISAVWHFTQHRNHEWWWKNFRNAGNPERPWTVEAVTAGERIVFTSDEENVKAILATKFADFGKGERFQREWNDFLGWSIFTTDGELWHNSRQLLRPQFIKDRVSDLHTFEAHVQVLLPMLAGSHNGATVRADDLFYRFTLDAATDFLLGKSVESLQHGQTEFSDAFAEVQRVQSLIARAGPVNRFVPRRSFYRALEVLNRFVGQYIDRALALPQEELEKLSKSDEGYTFLHAIVGYTRDPAVLRDQLIAVLLAGRDTTAVTLSWIFHELSKNPAIVQKLRQEIVSHVGLGKEPTYADLKSMKYLQATINETLRLYPVVPYNVRVALKDTTLPSGGGPSGREPIGIAKDTPIGYSTYILHHRPDIYPPTSPTFADPETFSPDRWEHWTPKSWTYVPFNGGPRICIGQQFALTEMAYTVVRTLQTFERVEKRMEGEPGLKSDIVLQPARGVAVGFFK